MSILTKPPSSLNAVFLNNASGRTINVGLTESSQQVHKLTKTIVFLSHLDSEHFELIEPVNVVIQQVGDEFLASVEGANINASGETLHESLDNVMDMIESVYQCLENEASRLGIVPSRQLAFLKKKLRRKK